ncbi:MAG: hypothetical protein R3272_01335, partial [Candidatus Promineifilaceae bacterium]|nr:hypothetical protein [Candidatus Promineifilaceae bacterium]
MPDQQRDSQEREAKGETWTAAGPAVVPELELFARRLAQEHEQALTAPGASAEEFLEAFTAVEKQLRAAHRYFADEGDDELSLSYAAEWLLDNFYIIRRAERQVRHDLPPRYYEQLPQLDVDGDRQYPRIYHVALALVDNEECQVDIKRLKQFVDSYQEVSPLSMGEIWALPTLLRAALLLGLAHATGQMTDVTADRPLPLRPERQPALSDGDVIANCIPSLIRLDKCDWRDFFESVSHVERALAEDPAALYRRLEFDTRDRYRKVVEVLARETGIAEAEIAAATTELAAAALPAGEAPADWEGIAMPREAHVGYYLIDSGRRELERRLGYEPRPLGRLSRLLREHPTALYLGAIGFLSLLFLGALAWYAAAAGAALWQLAATLLLALIPTVTVAVSLTNWIITEAIAPRVLPKLDFSEEIPASCRTAVVVPSLLTSVEEVESLLAQLEQHYLRNCDPNLIFALLTDWGDAETEQTPDDIRLLTAAVEGVNALNRRYSDRPFYLFHRRRLWNERERVWMGWERKRGKLHEFNRLLRGDDNTSFMTQAGALEQIGVIE